MPRSAASSPSRRRCMSGLGIRFYEPPIPPVLGTVEPDGPAAHAGLKSGDTILAVDGQPVHDFQELQKRIRPTRADASRSVTGAAARRRSLQVPVLAEVHDGKTIGRIHVTPAATAAVSGEHAAARQPVVAGGASRAPTSKPGT